MQKKSSMTAYALSGLLAKNLHSELARRAVCI